MWHPSRSPQPLIIQTKFPSLYIHIPTHSITDQIRSAMASSKYRLRSISLPPRSHPTTLTLDHHLHKLAAWESTSASTSDSVITGLTLLEDSYLCLHDLLSMPSTQQVVSLNRGEKSVEELLDGSVKILDFCGIARDSVFQIRENLHSLHSALRRRKGDSSTETSITEYNVSVKKMKKNARKMVVGLKQLESRFGEAPILNLDTQFCAVVRVSREVIGFTISVLQLVLSFLALWASKPKATKWSIVARLVMHEGVIACDENDNELQNVDWALSGILREGGSCNVEKMKSAHERLEALEIAIESMENGLESMFRRLIRTRASLLNIISQ